MEKKFSLISVALILVLCLTLVAGCGQKTDKKETTDESLKAVELTVAGQDPEDHPNTIALRELKERVEKETDGRIKMSIYPANQLGDYTTMYEEVMKGSIDMALINVPSQYEPRMEFLYVPYLATSYEEVPQIYSRDSVVGKEFAKLNEESGVKWLGFSMSGCVGIATTKEMSNPTDFGADKGVMIRIPGMDIFKHHMSDFGFRTVTIPYAELYTALQTGVADGCIGTSPLDTYSTVKDVIDYYYLYNVFFDCMSYVANMEKFSSLELQDQQLIIDICDELSKRSVSAAIERDKKYLNLLEDNGVEIVEFKQEELEALAKDTREISWPKMYERLSEELMNTLRQGLE